jgi:hypothetical protein
MAARTVKIRHDDETRAKIQAAHIIRRFQECLDGTIELTPVQVSCGKTLLDRVLPVLQAVDHSGDVTTAYVVRAPLPAATVDEWSSDNPTTH